MKKQLPVILLIILCVALAVGLYRSRSDNDSLREELAGLTKTKAEPVAPEPAAITALAAPVQSNTLSVVASPEKDATPVEGEMNGRRMMKSMAKMMDNPTMNKVMEASQRGAVGALYSDLIEYLDLDADETQYFMDLLMSRQMKNVELGMKMMSGEMSEDEKTALMEEIKQAADLVDEEMEKFLNNPDDFSEFEFYEKTMGERMMLSQMDQQLAGADASLTDEAYRDLLGMMRDEKENFDFSSNLHDDENMDLSPERFSKENLQNFAGDMDRLNANIIEQAEGMLTAEQQEAFKAAIKTTADMQKAQLEMAAQMFGGGEKPTAP